MPCHADVSDDVAAAEMLYVFLLTAKIGIGFSAEKGRHVVNFLKIKKSCNILKKMLHEIVKFKKITTSGAAGRHTPSICGR